MQRESAWAFFQVRRRDVTVAPCRRVVLKAACETTRAPRLLELRPLPPVATTSFGRASWRALLRPCLWQPLLLGCSRSAPRATKAFRTWHLALRLSLRRALLFARAEALRARQLALLTLLRALLLPFLRPRRLRILIARLTRIEALRVRQLALLALQLALLALQLALLALLSRPLLLLRPRGLRVLIARLARIEPLRVRQLALLALLRRPLLLLLRPRGLRVLIARLARIEPLHVRQLALLALLRRPLLLGRPDGLRVLIARLARIEPLRVRQLALLALLRRPLQLLRPPALLLLVAGSKALRTRSRLLRILPAGPTPAPWRHRLLTSLAGLRGLPSATDRRRARRVVA
jgi:hypothetical protein